MSRSLSPASDASSDSRRASYFARSSPSMVWFCRFATWIRRSYSATGRITASGSLWLVTTTLPWRLTAFITPRQPSFLTSEAGVRGRSARGSAWWVAGMADSGGDAGPIHPCWARVADWRVLGRCQVVGPGGECDRGGGRGYGGGVGGGFQGAATSNTPSGTRIAAVPRVQSGGR